MLAKTLSTVSKKGLPVMFAAAFLLSIASSFAAPGQARAAWTDCNSSWICAWEHENGGGTMVWWFKPSGCYGVGIPNAISSAWNRSGSQKIKFHSLTGCTGTYWYTVSPGQSINFTSWPHKDNFESATLFY